MIVVLAGRRIDALHAEEKKFPIEMEEIVFVRIRDFFHNNNVKVLISSAACGADLLAQKVAQEFGIEQHIILPFEREKFRKTSVTDRPGDWGKLFDDICDEVASKGNLIVLEGFEDDEEKAYSSVTAEILKYAKSLQSKNEKVLAVAVWEGKVKDKKDETDSFLNEAKEQDIRAETILTIN